MSRPVFPTRALALGAYLLSFSGCTVLHGEAMPGAYLKVWPDTVVLAPGQSETVMLDLSTSGQVGQGPYQLSVSPLPGLLTLTVDPPVLQNQGRAYLTLRAAAQARSGQYPLTVTVTDGWGKTLHGHVQVFLGENRPAKLPYFPSFRP